MRKTVWVVLSSLMWPIWKTRYQVFHEPYSHSFPLLVHVPKQSSLKSSTKHCVQGGNDYLNIEMFGPRKIRTLRWKILPRILRDCWSGTASRPRPWIIRVNDSLPVGLLHPSMHTAHWACHMCGTTAWWERRSPIQGLHTVKYSPAASGNRVWPVFSYEGVVQHVYARCLPVAAARYRVPTNKVSSNSSRMTPRRDLTSSPGGSFRLC